MTVLVSDSFNRANSTTTLGVTDSYNGGTAKTWTTYGTVIWGIDNNQAYGATAGGGNDFVGVNAGVSDGIVTVTFSTNPSGGYVVLRAIGQNNYLMFQNKGSNYVLYHYSSGWTTLGTWAKTPAVGDIIQATLNGTSITITINGAFSQTITDSTNTTGTIFGMATNQSTTHFDNFQIEDLTTGGTGTALTLSLSDSITLGESFTKVRSGKLTLTDSINTIDTLTIKSTRFLSLVDSITTGESFTKRRQAYLSLTDGISIGDTETSTRATINTLVRALSDSINMTDSITIRAMRYLTIFDLFSIVDSIGTTGGGNVAQTIKFKRGNEVDLPTLAEGEPAITMDTNKMFVGTPNGNRQIATLLVVDSVANLPIAEKSKQFLISGVLGGTGTADALYVCKKLSNDTYDWVQFV
jgi:hypothetical protein